MSLEHTTTQDSCSCSHLQRTPLLHLHEQEILHRVHVYPPISCLAAFFAGEFSRRPTTVFRL